MKISYRITDYYQVGKTRRASLGQFLRRWKHSQRPTRSIKKKTKNKKRHLFEYELRMLLGVLARVGQNFTNVPRDGSTKDNILNF